MPRYGANRPAIALAQCGDGNCLSLLGADVCTVFGGEDALQAVPGHGPSVIFLDFGMPHMDGFAVARCDPRERGARRHPAPGAQRVGESRDLQGTHEAGFGRHLVKPADPGAVVAAVLDHSPRTRGARRRRHQACVWSCAPGPRVTMRGILPLRPITTGSSA